MDIPAGFSESGSPGVEGEEDKSVFILEVLQSLYFQQDEHKALAAQVSSLQKYWDLQQKWNRYAQKSKALEDKNRQVKLRYKKGADDRRIQRLMLQHQMQLEEARFQKEEKEELHQGKKELAEHCREWKVVIEELNTYQEAMHSKWAGRFELNHQAPACDQNKALLRKVVNRLHDRMQKKEVCFGLRAGGIHSDARTHCTVFTIKL